MKKIVITTATHEAAHQTACAAVDARRAALKSSVHGYDDSKPRF